MFKSIIRKVKEALYKMGLIKGIKDMSSFKEVPVDNEMYERMEMWKLIYSGFYEDWHKVFYMTVEGQRQRIRPSLRMAKFVSQKMATLIFNEKCEINVSDETLKKELDIVLKENMFYSEFRRHLEYCFAIGGMVMKVYYELDKIKIAYAPGDCFIPLSWSNSKIDEGVFISQFRRGQYCYTHLEWHVWENGVYTIKNELYKSEKVSEIGLLVPLEEVFEDLDELVTLPNVKKTTFIYLKPNIANNLDTNSPLGISIFANALDTLKMLDIAYDSFQREFILGKKRIIVPQTALKTVVDPQTGDLKRYFDAEDEAYVGMNLGGGIDAEKIHDISVEIRVDEHIAAINALLKLLAMQIGMNAGTFTFDGTAVKTATEVISENSETFRTKQDHETNVEFAIQQLVDAIVEIAETFSVFSSPADYQVSVAFDDSIAEDKAAEINKQILLITNGLNSKERAIQKIFGMTEKEAQELMKIISAERATLKTEEVDVFGMNGA